MSVFKKVLRLGAVASLGGALMLSSVPANALGADQSPSRFIVPAGTGGGADQMAQRCRALFSQAQSDAEASVVVISKSGGAGGEGFLDVKNAKGDRSQADHYAIEPVYDTDGHGHSPFTWKDLTRRSP